MLKRLLAIFGLLAAMLLGAAPVEADAGTVTQTMHFTSLPDTAAPLPCSPAAGLVIIREDNGNAVIHITSNANGFWETGTYEGDLHVLPALSWIPDANGNVASFVPDSSRPTLSGHIADWFGVSFNPTVAIQHDAANAQLTSSAGQSVAVHATDFLQVAVPSFTVRRTFSNFTCS